jgi:hypothetical protein
VHQRQVVDVEAAVDLPETQTPEKSRYV